MENFIYICNIKINLFMDATSMWVVGIVLIALFEIIGFLVNYSLNQLKESFNMLLLRIDRISATLETHNDKLISILTKHEVTSQWLDNHEKEIDEIKCKQARLETKLNKHQHK